MLKIDNETFRYLSAFSTLTGVSALDCFKFNGEVIYVVEPGKISVAVGKGGSNIKKVENLLNRRVRLIEYSNDAITFVRNVMFPANPRNILMVTKSDGSKVIKVVADNQLKRRLFKDGKKLFNLINALLERHFPAYTIEVVDK